MAWLGNGAKVGRAGRDGPLNGGSSDNGAIADGDERRHPSQRNSAPHHFPDEPQMPWRRALAQSIGWLKSVATALSRQATTSLRYRLVLLTTLIIVIGTLVSGTATYQAARVSLYSQLDLELLTIANQTAQQIATDFEQNGVSSTASLDTANVVVVLVAANMNQSVLVGDSPPEIDAPEIAIARIQAGASTRNSENRTGVAYRVVAVPFATTDGQAYALVIARELGPTANGLTSLAMLQWLISIVATAICVIVSIFVVRKTLDPIVQLASVVTELTSTDHFAPIEVGGTSEVTELERSFNTMIESIEASRSQQNRLIADAGHELRTPLTSLRTNIELLIADENSKMLPVEARSEILSDVAAQLGEFTSLVNDLVSLSRGEVAPSSLGTVDLAEVVRRAIHRARRRGPTMFFDVTVEPVYVMGDAVTLERAVTNLLDNAVKYSPPSGTITVRLDHDGLVIADEGPGIAEEDIPHIFERFYRSDSSRNTPGTGLGLSIVDHTISAHGGTIEVGEAASGGAEFTVRLPEIEPELED